MATKERLRRFVKRLLLLYGIWGVIYIPFNANKLFVKVETIAETSHFIFNTIFINGTAGHLWFFPALLFAVIFIWILQKKLSHRAILLISAFFLMSGIIFATYFPALKLMANMPQLFLKIEEIIGFIGTRNGLFYGLFYVSLGAYLASKNNQMKTRHAIWLFLASMGLLGLESYIAIIFLNVESTVLWFSVMPATYALFIIATKIEIPGPIRLSLLCRKLSTLLYTTHYMPILCWNYLGLQAYGLIYFLITLCAAFGISILILRLSSLIKPLKYMY